MNEAEARRSIDHAPFRWRSPLGASVGLFLLFGVFLNVLPAIVIPLANNLYGPAAGGAVIYPETDAALLGRSLEDVARNEPRLAALLVSAMTSMCGQMMGLGIAALAIAWFGLRRGQRWALWSLAVAGLAPMPYWLVVTAQYARFVGTARMDLWTFLIPAVLVLSGTAFGWWGLRRVSEPASATPGPTSRPT